MDEEGNSMAHTLNTKMTASLETEAMEVDKEAAGGDKDDFLGEQMGQMTLEDRH